MRKGPHAAEIPKLSTRKSIQALGTATFSRSVKVLPGRITMSAERLAMMSAEIRSQLLALLSPATRLIVVKDHRPQHERQQAWRNAVPRMVQAFKSVSDT